MTDRLEGENPQNETNDVLKDKIQENFPKSKVYRSKNLIMENSDI